MGPNTAKIDFGNGTVMTVENAVPDNGDYSNVYSMRLGIANTAEKVVEYGDDLKGFASEVEWDATGLTELQALSPVLGTWSATNPPSAKDLLLLYGSGLINATPDNVYVTVQYGTLTAGDGTIIRLHKDVWIDDIQRVPPDYSDDSNVPLSQGLYAKPDGSFFYVDSANQKRTIDWSTTTYNTGHFDENTHLPVVGSPTLAELIPKWIDAVSARKDDLTNASQTRMAYLQDQTEKYDRMVSLLSALVTALNKLLEGLTKFSS